MMHRYKYSILISNITELDNLVGEKGVFEFSVLSKTQRDDDLLIEGVVSFSRENNLDDNEILSYIANYSQNKDLKLISKKDMVESITNKTFYHGTTKEVFQGSNSYIYLTNTISQAMYHAKDRSESFNETPLIVKIDIDSLNHCDFLPDNDIDESNGYTTVLESYNDIGTILVVGNISCELFEDIEAFPTADDLEYLISKIHRNPEDLEDGDIIERINECYSYELKEINISLLDLNEWDVDLDYVEDYKDLDVNTMPPIIIHEFSSGNYSIVDGIHRLNACHKKGLKKIKAYVGRR